MSTPTLREYPHLPALTFEQCMAVFKLAKISHNMLAELLDLSRQSVYLWRKGRNPRSLHLDRVSTLAYRALACLRDKSIPAGKRPRRESIVVALNAINLQDRRAQDLLPAAWLPPIE